MKLLHLNPYYAVVGGLERYVVDVCEALEAAGHATVVVYSEATGREPRAARPSHHVPGLASGYAAPTPAALARFASILDDEKPDVVVVHEITHPDLAQLATAAAPSVRFAHDFKLLCPGRTRTSARTGALCGRAVGLGCQVIAWTERCMPRHPARALRLIARTRRLAALHRRRSEVVVASDFMRGVCLADGFAPDRVHVAPYFTAPGPVGDTPVPGRMLCPGRLVPEKGVDHLLRALARLPGPAHLVVAGDGPARASLEATASAAGVSDRVRFTGWLDRPALAKAYAEAEIVVVPSTWPEPFGIVGIEALAHGRAVVASDVGGVRQWLRPDVTGLLVPPRDDDALALAVRTLRDQPELRARLGAEGRRLVAREFSADVHVRTLLAVVDRARAAWPGRLERGA